MKTLQAELNEKVKKEITEGCLSRKFFLQYYTMFGLDDFLKSKYHEYKMFEEKVYIINVDASEREVQNFIKEQKYSNLCRLDFTGDILMSLEKEYVCFVEKNHSYDAWKISDMVLSLVTSQDDMVICYRNYLDGKNCLIKDVSSQYWIDLQDTHFTGMQLLELCVCNNINLYGDLSTLLVSYNSFSKAMKSLGISSIEICDNFKIIFEILLNSRVHFINCVYTYKLLKKYDDDEYMRSKTAYRLYLKELIQSKRIDDYILHKNGWENNNDNLIKPEITFFHSDSAEYYNLEPIAKLAQKRGYKIRYTMDKFEKAEIGIYCQHICYPENSKLSVILLHDMAQRHDIWPNIWLVENWDKFDIGIVPGIEWANRWANCASAKYVRPRLGTYMLGYPKSDNIFSEDILNKASALKKQFKYNFTVLYAPSWENDAKEDDFVKCLVDLPINLLIKQAPSAPTTTFQFVRDNIEAMRKMHEGKYDNLTYIETDENILVALAAANMVVSDESSVMTEATMYGIPSVAITDWRIPDQTPSRFACVPTEYVIKRKKMQMRDEVLKLAEDSDYYQEVKNRGADFFANKGNCCDSILNLIEECINNKGISDELTKWRVSPTYEIIDMWN